MLYALGAVCMFLVTQVDDVSARSTALMLAFCLCYFPTIALTNSITMQQVTDPGRDFPPIRVMGTLGWIVINLVVGFMRVEAAHDAVPARAARVRGDGGLQPRRAAAHAAAGARPAGHVRGVPRPRRAGDDEGPRPTSSSSIASILACIPLTFYYSFTNAYLNDVGVVNAAGKMTLGQMSEVGDDAGDAVRVPARSRCAASC